MTWPEYESREDVGMEIGLTEEEARAFREALEGETT